MGDSRRFDLFAKLISKNFPVRIYPRVADIAGGKGYLQLALKEHGYSKVITFDRRHRQVRRIKRKYAFFSKEIDGDFDLLVGMHPDEATDIIIVEAYRRQIPFCICPCCVMPSAIIYWGKHSYIDWIEHLVREAVKRKYGVVQVVLKMTGKNIVLIGKIGRRE